MRYRNTQHMIQWPKQKGQEYKQRSTQPYSEN